MFSAREKLHLKNCKRCARDWPIYKRLHKSDNVYQDWMNLPEMKRRTLVAYLLRVEYRSHLAPFQRQLLGPWKLFVKDRADHLLNAEEWKDLATEWKNLPPENKQFYIEKAKYQKQERLALLKNLPPDIRRQARHMWKHSRQVRAKKQSPNAFVLFVKSYRTTQKYPEAVKEAAELWKTLDSDQKSEYYRQAQELKDAKKNARDIEE